MIKNFLPALVLGLSALSSTAILTLPVHAEDKKAEQVHVRGSIVNYSGSTLKVKTRRMRRRSSQSVTVVVIAV